MKYFGKQSSKYGGGWALSETPEKALQQARINASISAREADKGKFESYVLELPDDANITVETIYGGVSWDKAPTRVVETRNMEPDRVTMLRLQCETADGALYFPKAADNLSEASLSGWRVMRFRTLEQSDVVVDNVSGLHARIIANALSLTNA